VIVNSAGTIAQCLPTEEDRKKTIQSATLFQQLPHATTASIFFLVEITAIQMSLFIVKVGN